MPSRAQGRQAIQSLEEAKDSIQTLHVGSTYIMTGSVDGHVRTYDLRKGELRADFIGRTSLSTLLRFPGTRSLTQLQSLRPCDCDSADERPPVIPGHHSRFSRSVDGQLHGEVVK